MDKTPPESEQCGEGGENELRAYAARGSDDLAVNDGNCASHGAADWGHASAQSGAVGGGGV